MKFIDKIGLRIGNLLRWIIRIDTNQGQLKFFPDPIIWLSSFISLSALFQAITDYIFEILSFFDLIFKIPLRFEFIFLTFISAVLGYFTLDGLKRRELDVTRNSVFLSFVVEWSLLLADVYFIFNFADITPEVIALRIPYMFLTGLNIILLTFIVIRGKIFGFGIDNPYELY
jgi:hypothetical protein